MLQYDCCNQRMYLTIKITLDGALLFVLAHTYILFINMFIH